MNFITIERNVFEKNDEIAGRNRALLAENKILALNLIGSPGAGKTTILERTLAQLDGVLRAGVIEGDVQTDLDARRVSAYDVPAVQIVTRGGCHLEANLIHEALLKLDLNEIELLIIENVGNLVCPANFDLGEAMKVVVVSVTEGDDKPLKYPGVFREASVLLINKTDLLPYVNSDAAVLRRNALSINPHLEVFEISCTTHAGVARWSNWLVQHTRIKISETDQ